MNLPKGTQRVNRKTAIQIRVCLSPNARHNLAHYATFSPEVGCLWLSQSCLVPGKLTGASGFNGNLKNRSGEMESGHIWSFHKCLDEMARHQIQRLCPSGQDFQVQEESIQSTRLRS